MIRYKEENEENVIDRFAKASIMFEKSSQEESNLKESYFRPEENLELKTPTPDGTFYLPGEEDPYISNNSISNNSNSNNSNSNIQFDNSNNPINNSSSKEQNKYILKDSSIISEPATPGGSYNNMKNSQEENKNQKGKEGNSGGSGFNSSKGSDLKESGFSIFEKENK